MMKLSSQFDHDPAYTRFARQSGLRAADFAPPSRLSRRTRLLLASAVLAAGFIAITAVLFLLSNLVRSG